MFTEVPAYRANAFLENINPVERNMIAEWVYKKEAKQISQACKWCGFV